MTISNLNKICMLLRGSFPAIDSGKDLALVLEVGRRQEAGMPMTQKQLCLCGIAPAATVRRRLRRLVAKRIIRKSISNSDGRSVTLCLSETALKQLKQVSRSVKQLDW
jgi:DNA-binding MarR family transcriptional regulator